MTRVPKHPIRNVFVLSGGAARGAAQVGMMRSLLQHGITPHALVGTSIGALNATFVACDPTLARVTELENEWLRVHGHDVFGGNSLFGGTKATVVRSLLRRRPYLYANTHLAELISSWIPYDRLEDIPTPLRVATTHLGTGRATYHRAGPVLDTLLASAALPGVFPPVQLTDPQTGRQATHVDGGIADLIPSAGAADLAPTHLYVLDVTVPPVCERITNPLDVIIASLGVAMRLRPGTDFGPGVPVTHLRADELSVSMTDFTQSAQLIELGAFVTETALAAESAVLGRGRATRTRLRHVLRSRKTFALTGQALLPAVSALEGTAGGLR